MIRCFCFILNLIIVSIRVIDGFCTLYLHKQRVFVVVYNTIPSKPIANAVYSIYNILYINA